MVGYDPIKRDNYFHKLQVKNLFDRSLINEEEYMQLNSELTPAYKQTNIFINVGLFVFSCIIMSSAIGLLALIFSGILNEKTSGFLSYLTATALLIGLQKIIIDKRDQFRTGIDDAVLYAALLFVFIGTFLLFENSIFNKSLTSCVFFILLFGIPAKIFYDRLLFGLTLISVISFLFFILYELGGLMVLLIPFLVMGLCYLCYKISINQLKKNLPEAIEQCWEVIEWLCILVFYLAGNIFVITELSNELGLSNAFPEPVRWLFYAFTIVIPVLYIYYGLIKKKIHFINIGLGTLAIGVFAIRYYHSILDIEYALLLGGIFLIGLSWVAIKFIKKLNREISVDQKDHLDSGLKIESLIVDQTFGKVAATDNQGFSGKGGQFGGGGSTGSF